MSPGLIALIAVIALIIVVALTDIPPPPDS